MNQDFKFLKLKYILLDSNSQSFLPFVSDSSFLTSSISDSLHDKSRNSYSRGIIDSVSILSFIVLILLNEVQSFTPFFFFVI